MNFSERNEGKFDIIFPLGPNDVDIFKKYIKYNQQNILNYRNIYVVSYDPSIEVNGCITIDENKFLFLKTAIQEKMGDSPRVGWYFQQLIKLYSHKIIDGLLDKYLVMDTDMIFIKPTEFFTNDKTNFSFSGQYHYEYFIHMKKLHPCLIKQNELSGICDHMMFEKRYLEEMFQMVENYHEKTNELDDFSVACEGEDKFAVASEGKFYKLFIDFIDPIDYHVDGRGKGSGASEYEMYFNFMLIYHKEVVFLKKLNYEFVPRKEIDSYLFTFLTEASPEVNRKQNFKNMFAFTNNLPSQPTEKSSKKINTTDYIVSHHWLN
jgi:hypothetical protein